MAGKILEGLKKLFGARGEEAVQGKPATSPGRIVSQERLPVDTAVVLELTARWIISQVPDAEPAGATLVVQNTYRPEGDVEFVDPADGSLCSVHFVILSGGIWKDGGLGRQVTFTKLRREEKVLEREPSPHGLPEGLQVSFASRGAVSMLSIT